MTTDELAACVIDDGLTAVRTDLDAFARECRLSAPGAWGELLTRHVNGGYVFDPVDFDGLVIGVVFGLRDDDRRLSIRAWRALVAGASERVPIARSCAEESFVDLVSLGLAGDVWHEAYNGSERISEAQLASDYDGFLAGLAHVYERDPGRDLFLQARRCSEAADTDTALTLLTESWRVAPVPATAHALAEIQHSCGLHAAALAWAERAYALNRRHARFATTYAIYLIEARRPAEARDVLDHILTVNPQYGPARRLRDATLA